MQQRAYRSQRVQWLPCDNQGGASPYASLSPSLPPSLSHSLSGSPLSPSLSLPPLSLSLPSSRTPEFACSHVSMRGCLSARV